MLFLLACTDASEKLAEPHDSAPEVVCTPLGAVFFDLGETLVTEGKDGLFSEFSETTPLLDALGDTPLGVITNVPDGTTREDLEAMLVDPSLLDRFDVVMMSSEASKPKPFKAIYEEAVALLPEETPIEQTAFVTEEIADIADADPASRGAMGAGMIGVLVAEKADPLADYTFTREALPTLAEAAWVQCLEAH